jgi:two-component system phosphate regulon sensor histidine kinase PhoR
MKNDFINNMTHEFKTPIATISLATDSINAERVKSDPEKVMRFANIIKEENNRMLNQVEKVLQMARIDKKEFELNLSSFDLHKIIEKAVEHANLKVMKKEGDVISFLEADPSVIEGDVTHISNIVYNLLDNANKYSPVKPHIEVSTQNVNGGVQMVVKDNGIGMTKEAQRHIFDKFFRVHTGNLHDVKGFGLGLSYVKALITAHGGTVSVDSDLGKGSSFIVFFPYKTND